MLSPRHSSTPTEGSFTHDRPRRAGAAALSVLTLVLSASLLLAGQPVTAAAPSSERSRPETVAQTDQGSMTSRIVGTTSAGRKVTGTFTPLHVVSRHGDLMVKGIVQGVVREASGGTSTFTAIRSLPIRSVDGQQLGRGAAVSGRASCDILHLVLGPLDLDLLGLQVHLNRVILDIVAVTGAGNLLGNLLCAITGLLDGTPAAGLLAQIASLLNQILAALRLGV